MKRFYPLIKVWQARWLRLFIGLILAELSICAAFLLMGQTGSRLGLIATAGAFVTFGLLRWAGSARLILRYGERLATHDATFRVLADIRLWFYRRLARGAAAGLGFRRTGDLLTRLVSDVQSLDSLYLRIIIPLATALLSLPIVIFICLKGSMLLAFSIAIIFCLTAFILPAFMARMSYRWGPVLQQAQSEMNNQALELVSGMKELRIFGQEDAAKARLFAAEEAFYQAQRQQSRAMARTHTLALFLTRLGVICALGGCAGLFFSKEQAVIGITVLFVVMTALDNIVDLPRAGLIAGQVCHAAERIIEATKMPASQPPEGSRPAPKGYDITAQALSFGWSEGRSTLKNINFILREGERVALIGPSGAGKSSLAALLLKVVSPQEGCLTLGGADIADIKTEIVRERIAWLSQASHLFDDTIRANLLLGREAPSDEVIWAALEQAQIADFVRSLPDGLESWVGENGSQLSGGQGRRIALARVLLSNAPILILDEPCTGLDIDTERAFLKTLNQLDRSRTILLITHRLTGIEQLDRLWTLQDGLLTSHIP
ncbi:thiol reductant ABC exporter subunit CydC [Bombella sp. ESL0378]|uniref:thiol reductant ABC exporter subunit CydC n=1 Tax=Bombella sp. ESL0378 TaxID=2676442 RepID=UPI0012D9483B|nr:thiol reductant ABC exporter subunit CydC [Bombella sp. ESL0378]MUG04660.1 thiol reductant ABC exporter subunit CydC [Bombella sp. ESL0378]